MDKKYINKKYMLGGSYTVEAAFLIPFILGIVFAWWFQLFYLHDQVILNGMLKECIIEEDMGVTEDESLVKEKIQAHLWIMKVSVFEKKEGALRTKYRIVGEAIWNIPLMNRFLGNHLSYELSDYSRKISPETVLRLDGKTKEEK